MSNNPPPLAKLSPAMVAALRSIYLGRAWEHIRGRSMHGGYGQTRRALIKLGLIDRNDELTEAGRDEIARRFPR